MKDLLLSQRVCRKWQAVVERCQELQEALFFSPKAAAVAWSIETSPSGHLICERVPPEAVGDAPDGESGKHIMKKAELNPMLFVAGEDNHSPELLFCLMQEGASECFFFRQDFIRKETSKTGWGNSNASWRKMLVVQPPVKDW